eukprot:scaffold72819_cov62-Cyclotella_meneghiniana.AAC.1
MNNTEQSPSDLVTTSVVSCHDLFAILNNHYQQTGSLDMPSNHSTFSLLLDCLTAMNAEQRMKERWDEMMEELTAFKAEHGHCNTNTNSSSARSDSSSTSDADLDNWVKKQRHYYKLYERQQPSPLTSTRYQRLKAIGLISAPNKWELKYQELKQYKIQHGHADVPIHHKGLGIWCLNQRFNLQHMPRERIDKLDALSFTWNYNTRSSNEEAWDVKYQSLLTYIRQHGHANVPKSNEPLSCWVRKQRYEYGKFIKKQKSQITRERIRKLNNVGFAFRLRPDVISWDRHFEDLMSFQREHGHFNVPRNHPTLGSWVTYQKSQFKYFLEGRASTIDQAKADKLVSVGLLEIENSSTSGGGNDSSQTVIPVLPPMMVGGANINVSGAYNNNWEHDFGFGFNNQR